MTRPPLSLALALALTLAVAVGCDGGGGDGGGGDQTTGPRPVSAATSTFTLAPAMRFADGTEAATLTVVARDAAGTAVPGKTVSFALDGRGALSATSASTDAVGSAWVTLVSTVAGVVTAHATVGGVSLPDRTVTFRPGSPSPAASTLEATPASVPADGATPVTLRATVRDVHGNLFPHAAVQFDLSGAAGTVSPSTTYTDAEGVATCAVTSLYGGTVTARVLWSSTDLATADVTFVPDPVFQLAAVRAEADGAVVRPVQGVRVTSVGPALGGDPAGFFVQAARTGPALFVAVNPASLFPVPAAGDDVSFRVQQLATVQGMRRATAISAWMRHATAQPLAGLVQDVGGDSSLVAAVSSFEGELVVMDATLLSTLAPSGAGMSEGALATAGLPGDPGLRVRVADSVLAAVDLAPACSFRLGPMPLWRRDALAQPSAFSAADVALASCPAPRLLSAFAIAAGAVRLRFDRHIALASLSSPGTQLAFSGGLTATGATVSGRDVIVATSAQTQGAAYAVTVAQSVTDTLGAGVDAAHATASFTGYRPIAVLALHEVSPIALDRGLVELVVSTGGWAGGIRLEHGYASPTLLATLPDMQYAAGDFVVVHLNPPAGLTTETSSKTQCAHDDCYNGVYFDGTAWDVAGVPTTLPLDSRVLLLRSAQGTVDHAVPFSMRDPAKASAGFLDDFAALQAAGLWTDFCGGHACTLSEAVYKSAFWDVQGSMSAQRWGDRAGTSARHWTQGASTWGAANPLCGDGSACSP